MIGTNALVLKELIQGAHRKHTYVVRTLMPLVATWILVPQVLVVIASYGNDWRAIAGLSRPAFLACAWIQVVMFPMLAATYAKSSLHEEWQRSTMEVLCAAPMSPAAIVYGKFLAAFGKVFLMGLTLLPVMGIWLHMGRIPKEMALGSVAVIAGATALFGALAAVCAAGTVPKKGHVARGADIILLYHAVPVLLGALVWKGHPAIIAAVPHWAFYLVINGTPPGGMTVGRFALLSLGECLAVALIALATAPMLFARVFRRHIGEGEAKTRKKRRSVAADRSRRPLGLDENPIWWQEKDRATRHFTVRFWAFYASLVAMALIGFAVVGELEVLGQAVTFAVACGAGLAIVLVLTLNYALRIFPREKMQKTNQSLVLTGVSARDIYRGKLGAILWGLRFAYPGILLPGLYALWLGDNVPAAVAAALMAGAIIGPPAAAVVGLVFGSVARNYAQASRAVFMGIIVFPILINMFCFIGACAAIILGIIFVPILLKSKKIMNIWLMSFALGLVWIASMSLGAGMPLGLRAAAKALDISLDLGEVDWVVSYVAMITLAGYVWYRVGIRVFEAALLDEAQLTVAGQVIK